MQLASPSPGSHLALVQLSARLRRGLKRFRKITGLTAVASVVTSPPEPGTSFAVSPPVHPRCARKLQSISNAPCGEQWMIHVRHGRRSPRTRSHTCPIGMRCSCVPIRFGDHLVGVAKLVVDSETAGSAFTTGLNILKLVVSETCQDSAVTLLTEEVLALRKKVSELQQIHSSDRPSADGHFASSRSPGATDPDIQRAALVERALAQVQRHYQDPRLSLRTVAGALGCNPRYLTTRFSAIVGEHMHAYLVALRVSHACRLLMTTDSSIKGIALESGFSGSTRLASAFRHHVGVSPGTYRRIFSGP